MTDFAYRASWRNKVISGWWDGFCTLTAMVVMLCIYIVVAN